jgi:hypothetical protein
LRTYKGYREFYELDTAGNQLNYILGTDTNGPDGSNMLLTNDGGYIVANSYVCYRNITEDKWLGSIAKLDSNFHEVWKIEAGPCSQHTEFYTHKLCADGNYIAVGQWYDEADTPYTHMNGWVVKYSGDGQVIWSKLYRGISSNGINGDDNRLYSMAFMSDNSILCAGQAASADLTTNPQQQGWLLHLDTAGCLPDSNNCGIVNGVTDIPQASGRVRAYPNPASEQIRFEVVWDEPSAYTLSIMDMVGRGVSEVSVVAGNSAMVDVRGWSAGLYLYRVMDEKGGETGGRFVVE